MKGLIAGLLLLTVVDAGRYWSEFVNGPWSKYYQSSEHWIAPSGQSFNPPGQSFNRPGHSFTPPGHTFTPPGHSFTPPGHSFIPPGHSLPQTVREQSPCQLLEQLFSFKVKQLNDDMGKSCTAAWVCQDPATGYTTITYIDGRAITFSGLLQQNGAKNNEDSGHSNLTPENSDNVSPDTGYPNNNENLSTKKPGTPTPPVQAPTTPVPQTNEPSRQFGGEGLIDVRIGGD